MRMALNLNLAARVTLHTAIARDPTGTGQRGLREGARGYDVT